MGMENIAHRRYVVVDPQGEIGGPMSVEKDDLIDMLGMAFRRKISTDMLGELTNSDLVNILERRGYSIRKAQVILEKEDNNRS